MSIEEPEIIISTKISGSKPAKQNKNKTIYIFIGIVLLILAAIFLLLGGKKEKTTSIPTAIPVKTTAVNFISSTPVKTPTVKITEKSSIVQSSTFTPTIPQLITITPTNIPLLEVEDSNKITEDAAEVISTVENDNTELNSTRDENTHWIIEKGTYFYLRPIADPEIILRWLPADTEIEILSGPIARNGQEWYEIFCEKYNQTGWVISTSVIP